MFGLIAAYLIRRMFACGSLDGNKSVAPHPPHSSLPKIAHMV